MGKDKSPARMDKEKFDKVKAGPSCTTYLFDRKDDRKILSHRKKSLEFRFGDNDRSKNKNMERMFDVHLKNKKYLPPVTKYHFTGADKAKLTSSSPLTRPAHKR
jgi:hypothetical protein